MRTRSLFIFLVLAILSPVPSLAQKDSIVFFLNDNQQVCPAESASFIGIAVKENDRVKFSEFTYPLRNIMLVGFFSDSTFASREGEFRYYDVSGKLTGYENYHLNEQQGYTFHLTEDYQCKDSAYYENGQELTNVTYSYVEKKKYARTYNNLRTNTKELTTYFEDGTIKSYGKWIDNVGEQTEYFPISKRVKSIIKRDDNKIVSEKYFYEDGSEMPAYIYKQMMKDQAQDAIKKMEEKMIVFPEDYRKRFLSYFRQYFDKELRDNTYSGSYRMTFMLDKKGSPYNLVIDGVSPASHLYRCFESTLRRCPNFNMKGNDSYGPMVFTLNLY